MTSVRRMRFLGNVLSFEALFLRWYFLGLLKDFLGFSMGLGRFFFVFFFFTCLFCGWGCVFFEWKCC